MNDTKGQEYVYTSSNTNEKLIDLTKKTYSLSKRVSDATAKIFKRHSTQFWVLKLMDSNLAKHPKVKYIKLLVNKSWMKRVKIIKMYRNISSFPVHINSFIALKNLYSIHHYIFLGPPETICPEGFNLEEFLVFISKVWTMRFVNENYEKEDMLKNTHISKFICSYSEFLRAKIAYHKKYPYIENNFSLENLVKRNNFDFNLLIDKKFITDTISFYSLVYQKLLQIPFLANQIPKTLDSIAQVFNEELISVFNLIFYVIVGFKNFHSSACVKSNSTDLLRVFDSQFIEITNKSRDYIEKLKKFRNEINSTQITVNFAGSNVYAEYLQNLDNNLKFFPVMNFNVRNHFSLREISGIKLNRSVSKLIELNIFLNKSELNSLKPETTLDNQMYSSNRKPSLEFPQHRDDSSLNNNNNKGFVFSEEKFQNSKTSFDFDTKSREKVRGQERSSLQSNLPSDRASIHNSRARSHSKYENRIPFNVIPKEQKVPPQSLFNHNFFSKSNENEEYATVTSKNMIIKDDPAAKKHSLDDVVNNPVINNVLNELFDSNKNMYVHNNQAGKGSAHRASVKMSNTPTHNFNNPMMNSNITYGKAKPNQLFNVINKDASPMKISYDTIKNNNNPTTPGAKETNTNKQFSNNNIKSNQNNSQPFQVIPNLDENYHSFNSNSVKYLNSNFLNNTFTNNIPMNNTNVPNASPLNNNAYNLNKNSNNVNPDPERNIQDQYQEEPPFESVNSQYRSDVSNINIYNIQHNYNEINFHKEETNVNLGIEKLANDFLIWQLGKPNLQWLISSKDIKLGKQIGFGGSSEVYLADYRGTAVAVKKLRILEIKEENLKEFKREVSSLIMLRHPNLVLFMGAIAEQDNICIVTEYCAGGTLFNILHQRRELIITWELRLKILLEIAVGMNFLHTNSPPIIHRDLKSLNILLTEKIEKPSDNTKIKISDFGLSKIIRQFDSNGREAMTGQLGTCHWMAPEVIENKDYSIKADIFSYGIIIWEMCTRKTPYQEMSQQQISFYVTVKKGRPDKSLIPPNTPQALMKLMEVCWDAEPNNRPSFSQIIDYLKKVLSKYDRCDM